MKEHDAEFTSFRDDEEHVKKMTEWLKIQEKKLDFLLNDPKGKAVAPEKREKWIKESQEAIAMARAELSK
ncbi:hypothetical protein LJC31_03740 [Synergistaceae bacterium OttesenSCG-928-I11]|nr:hypothetical protein [Synergistaceae bacterium OttesenSCG-928-I11]